MEVASLFNMWLVSGCEQKVLKAVRDAKKLFCNYFVIKNVPNMIFMLPFAI